MEISPLLLTYIMASVSDVVTYKHSENILKKRYLMQEEYLRLNYSGNNLVRDLAVRLDTK